MCRADGTGKGIRQHEPRDLITMYYATETTLEMGATCVIPNSQYYSINREGWYNSEDRLENGALLPAGPKTG